MSRSESRGCGEEAGRPCRTCVQLNSIKKEIIQIRVKIKTCIGKLHRKYKEVDLIYFLIQGNVVIITRVHDVKSEKMSHVNQRGL